MKYTVAGNGEVCGSAAVAAAICAGVAPPGNNCSKLFRFGEPIAKAACGAVMAPWYFACHHVALTRKPDTAAGAKSKPTEYVLPFCAVRSLLPPARKRPCTDAVLMRHVGVAAVHPGKPIAPG